MNRVLHVVRVLAAGLVAATVAGLVTGAAARFGMRLFALASGTVPDFSWFGSLGIASIFVGCALPAAIGAAATGRRLVRGALAAAGTALLAYEVCAIGIDEWRSALAHGPDGIQLAQLAAISAGFALVVLADAYLADRLAQALRRARRRPAPVRAATS